ncbi:hypothetical protein EJ07DRAFT_169879 [Lizonia empirigonia]|nr:hypothetical protein EJ07DRAFT_169879 [Lizonia empirigonia]
MAKQPGHQCSGYKVFDGGSASLSQLEKGRLSEWPEEERKALYDVYRDGFDKLQDELEDAQKNGKQVFMKEHAIFVSGPDRIFAHIYNGDIEEPLMLCERHAPNSTHTSPTCMPDSLLLSMTLIFQIRHPILMFPSMLRVLRKAMGPLRPRDLMVAGVLTLRHSRNLFDWYLSQRGELRPQVIDADDIINDRAAYEWEARVETDPMKAVFLSTISASKSIIPSLAAQGLDFEVEKAKWKAEFDEEDGEELGKFVLDVMPDYNYLLSQRTRELVLEVGHISIA